MRRTFAGLATALLLVAAPLGAQVRADTVAGYDLPDPVADAVLEFFNDARHVRFRGPTTIAAGDTVRAGVAVLEGPLVVAGRVEGDLVTVNADVRLLPGASITGDLWVVGGELEGEEAAAIGGATLTYPERLAYRRSGTRLARIRRGGEEGGRGRSDFLITTGTSYNRVEGLPITLGPRIQTPGRNPLRVQALAIYRTESGFTMDTDQMGYFVRAEQFLGGERQLRVGVKAHSLVDPVEDWHLTDLETGLATFLFHRDFRDHYERRGAGVFTTWEPSGGRLSLTTLAQWERHYSRAAGSPWSLFHNAEPWRPQPLVAEGRLASVSLLATYDTRSQRLNPSNGWYVRARVEQAFSSRLTRPEAYIQHRSAGIAPMAEALPAEPFDRFTAGTVDIRRYNRVDPRSRLNLRLLASSALDGSPLPPQRQHALGGEGSLPGYELFALDCGARDQVVYRSAAEAADARAPAFFLRYGCDAFAMVQAEYRGKLSLRFHWDKLPWRDDDEENEGWGLGWDSAPDWTVFVDAGRGWARSPLPDEDLAADVGFGLLVDRLGVFVAVPLTGRGGVNIFARLGPRF